MTKDKKLCCIKNLAILTIELIFISITKSFNYSIDTF